MASFSYHKLNFSTTVPTGFGQMEVLVYNSNFDKIGSFVTNNMEAIDRCNAADEEDVYFCQSAAWRKEAQATARRQLYNEFKSKNN